LALLLTSLCTACLSAAGRGDRAFRAGQFQEAIDLYEEEIQAGSRDPEVFYRAGLCALRLGKFAVAERYYSRSLRYGGGLTVANALAELYLQSSNYTRAIQVLKYLLNVTPDDPQPVYNNLGTALMYANEPFDAESYLLIAQQLKPNDPTPYANLGILYDRHLKQPFVAVEFYECYLSLVGEGGEQGRTIALRVAELRQRHPNPSSLLTCGQAYSPKQNASLADLRRELGAPERAPIQVVEDESPPDPSAPIVVESGGSLPINPPQTASPPAPKPAEGARQLARAHLQNGKHEQAIATLEALPAADLQADDAQQLAESYLALQKPQRAELWARWAHEQDPSVSSVDLLLRTLLKLNKQDEYNQLCKKIASDAAMRPAMRHCPPEPAKL
jgi:tetratricopeptide (TPR) repeat protein